MIRRAASIALFHGALAAALLPSCRPHLTNACDPQGKDFVNTVVARTLLAERGTLCGLPYTYTLPKVYVVGFKRITAGNTDWWIKKYDENGIEDTTRWNKTYDGGFSGSDVATSCVVDGTGGLYVGGYQDQGGGNQNWWIKKFSSDGVEDTARWNKTFDGGALGDDELYAIRVDSNNNLYAVGRRYQAGTNDWWIKKFSADGIEDTANWNKSFNGPAGATDDAHDVFVAPDGSVYVAGEMETPATAWDFWIKKFSADGIEDTTNWNKSFDGGASLNDWVNHLWVDPLGNVYAAGHANRPTTGQDWWIKKFSSTGIEDTANWNKTFDGGSSADEFLRAFVVDSQGNVFAGGRLDPTGINMIWRVKKFSSGGIEDTSAWDKSFNADPGNLLDDVFGLDVDAAGNVYAAGLCARAATGEDWCVKKYNANGTEDLTNWNKAFDGGVSLNENAMAVCVHNQPVTVQ